MAKKDMFGDETTNTNSQDFASMLEMSERGTMKSLRTGDSFKGEILSINRDSVFVSTGTPTDGSLPVLEILDENKLPKFKTGDIIDVVVVRMKGDEILLRYKGAKGSSSEVDSLEDAFDMELPVEGKVLEAIKGGFRILIHGQKAFCPVSQLDTRISTDTSQYIGNKYTFLITQYESNGRNIVVSRRRILELEKAEFEGTFLQSHKVGDVLTGVVKRMEKFGAFVEIEGGLEGLVHISEIGWARLQDPSEVLRVGQTVSVKILKIEEEQTRLKIALSIKQGNGESDPWMTVPQKFPVGTIVDGTVEKKEAFGFFVQITPGVTGLLPKSKMKEDVAGHDYEMKKRGDPIKVQIDLIQFEERRISLRIPGEAVDESWRGHQGSSSGLGTLADLFKKSK